MGDGYFGAESSGHRRRMVSGGDMPARVLLAASPPCRAAGAWRGLERKRRTLWQNGRRNRAVAAVALAFLRMDVQALRACGLRLRREELPQTRGVCRVAVLVESTAHGHALLSLLPGWDLLDAVPTDDANGYDDGSDHSPDRRAGQVVTLVRAARRGLRADVLVRATGGRGRLWLRGFPPQRGASPSGLALLIDFADDFDAQAEQDTQARTRDYHDLGWTVADATTPLTEP